MKEHNLGFLSNVQKPGLNPMLALEFVRVLVNSQDMTLSLPIENARKLQGQCNEILSQASVLIRTLSKLIGGLVS